MTWTKKQKTNMRLLLEGWEERAIRRRKKQRLARMAKKGVVPGSYPTNPPKIPVVEDCLERFFSFLGIPTNTGCLEWDGFRLPFGTGQIRIADRLWLASRVAWILENGEIPPGLLVCHKCDNASCCNVDHLFLGTQKDNMADCSAKGRAKGCSRPGESNPTSKLTNENIFEIRALAGILSHRQIAIKFGVTRPNIGYIINRKTWWNI